ncbi:hypothetical protein CRG98_047301 [Punica granatum]|uniref:DYW domain-containing protein n=1 Tax=Punica granatum TaxID=22663 RepID=A0A2I0HKP9_PUNGR|nr:hypothetical protein CRG98_047301 [Punica granatum]
MGTRSNLRQSIDALCSLGSSATESVYTRLVLECVRANDAEQAARLQAHMESHSFRPNDTYIHNRLLHLYAKSGKVGTARNLFDRMPKRDVFSWNAMLSLFAKSRAQEDLWATFNDMPVRDSVSYNTVIAGFTDNRLPRKGLEVFAMMVVDGFQPTDHTYVSALHSCSMLLGLRQGKQIHGRIVLTGSLGTNAFVWNALINMYAKCGEINHAWWLFDKVPDKNVVSWNSMISAYLEVGLPEKCIEMFHEMQLASLKPDQVTISNVLNAYFETRRVDEARNLFSEVKGMKDKVCWTTMIAGYSQNGREEDALMIFRQMLLANAQPDSFTISAVISACAKLASLHQGRALHSKAILIGVDDNLLVSSALIDMYCKCGTISDARFVFNSMPSHNVVSWNAMIRGYAQNGRDQEALSLYESMIQANKKPDSVTFLAVLSACMHANLIEEGKKYFNSISKDHGITPTLDHYSCMIHLLGRSGRLDKALDLIKQMPHEPDSLIWSSFLSVCSKKGDIEHGEIAAKRLLEMDPFNAGPYIMLSNMYAAHSRWDDVASVRSLMNSRNVKKFAAYSWVEFDNKVHKFVSEDQAHPESEKIYGELQQLTRRLQEVGFVPNTRSVLHDVGEDEKFSSVCYHSEKLALAYSLLKLPGGVPIRILKNIRICVDCHLFMSHCAPTTSPNKQSLIIGGGGVALDKVALTIGV